MKWLSNTVVGRATSITTVIDVWSFRSLFWPVYDISSCNCPFVVVFQSYSRVAAVVPSCHIVRLKFDPSSFIISDVSSRHPFHIAISHRHPLTSRKPCLMIRLLTTFLSLLLVLLLKRTYVHWELTFTFEAAIANYCSCILHL